MAQVICNSGNLDGGTSGALQYGFNYSVTNAFSSPAKAATVFEGDFVAGVILSSTKSKAITGFNVATFPSITAGANAGAVEIGGDLFVTFRDTPGDRGVVFRDAGSRQRGWPSAASTGNKNINKFLSDAITRATELPISTAKSVVFDMSTSSPRRSAPPRPGRVGHLPDVLKSPSNISTSGAGWRAQRRRQEGAVTRKAHRGATGHGSARSAGSAGLAARTGAPSCSPPSSCSRLIVTRRSHDRPQLLDSRPHRHPVGINYSVNTTHTLITAIKNNVI
jgi:hypothetical protein